MNLVGVVGLGLIGGSFALAMKQNGARVIGVDNSPATRQAARAAGAIDEAAQDVGALAECETVFIAVPVKCYESVLADLPPFSARLKLIMDGGSCKRGVADLARRYLGAAAAKFVPAHPIAGSEESGFAAARAELFRGSLAVICPPDDCDGDALAAAREVWRCLGAKVVQMPPSMHDEVFSVVSHLPHLLSYALVMMLGRRPDADNCLRFAGGGFRDFARIACSDPAMWRDICLANSDSLLTALKEYQKALDYLAAAVEKKDGAALYDAFLAARQLSIPDECIKCGRLATERDHDGDPWCAKCRGTE